MSGYRLNPLNPPNTLYGCPRCGCVIYDVGPHERVCPALEPQRVEPFPYPKGARVLVNDRVAKVLISGTLHCFVGYGDGHCEWLHVEKLERITEPEEPR